MYFFYLVTGTSQEKGTGLGIGLSKEFVLLNEGSIDVESTVGVGTSFTVTWKKAKTSNIEVSEEKNRYV